MPPSPPSLVPVPPPTVAQAPAAAAQAARAAAPVAFKTILDAPPADTLKARTVAEKTRQAIVSAVKAAKVAQDAVREASALDKSATAILAAEGLTADTLKKFTQTAGPLVDAFGASPSPETPSPVTP